MKKGRFKSIEDKRKFLQERKKQNGITKNDEGNEAANAKEEKDKKQRRSITQIVQGGSPN